MEVKVISTDVVKTLVMQLDNKLDQLYEQFVYEDDNIYTTLENLKDILRRFPIMDIEIENYPDV
jgi:hypothetical protein